SCDDSGTARIRMPSLSGTNGVEPIPPAQPIHVPRRSRNTGWIALTRPPGLRLHSTEPSGRVVSSTGRRLATTTSGLRGIVHSRVIEGRPYGIGRTRRLRLLTRSRYSYTPKVKCQLHKR